MAALSGDTGLVNGLCSEISEWSTSLTTEMLESTDFCSEGFKEFVAGLKGGTGELVSTEYYDTSEITNLALSNSDGGPTITGDVLFHENNFDNPVDGLRGYSQGFTFTGVYTITNIY